MGKFIWHQWAQFVNIFASVCASPLASRCHYSLLTPSGSLVFADWQMFSGLASGAVSSLSFSGTLSAVRTLRRTWPPPLAGRVPTPRPVVSCKSFICFYFTPPPPSQHRLGATAERLSGRCRVPLVTNSETDTTSLLPTDLHLGMHSS